MLVGPLPCVLQELLTGEVVLLDALFSQFLHHFCLGCNRSVISARHPEGVFAFHASAAHKNILNSVVQHVAHMQHTRHIRRWDHYRVRFLLSIICIIIKLHPVLLHLT